MSEKIENNPLLSPGLPMFDRIRPRHAMPALEHLIGQCREGIATALAAEPDGWDGLAAVEEELLDRLASAWAPVSHLHGVIGGAKWRKVYAEAALLLNEFHTELDQDESRFQAYRRLKESPAYPGLSTAQRRVVDNSLRDFHLAGIDLPPPAKVRYRELAQQLTELETRFEQNVQQASDAWSKPIESKQTLRGFPANELRAARQRAKAAGREGWLVTLDYPSYHAVLTYAEDRALREEVYREYHSRASDQGSHAGQWDNAPVIAEILERRRELARLVGFPNYAEYSFATTMVETPAEALEFLRDLAARARPRALEELAELTAFASDRGAAEPLEPWDVAYFSEQLRKQRFDISDEELRPYFPLPAALDGMMAVAGSVFGLNFAERTGVPVWHPEVRYFDVLDDSGEQVASFYLDLFARRGKRGGAWMGTCRSRIARADRVQRPVAFLNCNYAAPGEGHPSLLSHRELTTLFHEFGHCLHHMLTRVPHPAVGGIAGVEWDAVELPSQFLENWCWERTALDRFAGHFESGDALPQDLFQRMLDARHFQTGLFLVRQLEFGLTDLRLHVEFDPGDAGQIERIVGEVRDQVTVIRQPPENRSLNSFSHLFAGGYAAGYYSYLWAEQLSADAFSRFQEEGVFDRAAGGDFRREILEVGGSRDALDSFVAFRGREPRLEPLLVSYGILSEAEVAAGA